MADFSSTTGTFLKARIETVPPIETISPNHLNQFFDAIWRAIEYNYRVINQIDSIKLVIFDLDDTLWRGIIGEHYGDDGQHPLTIGWPMGVHEAIHHLKARGILVAICSKNSPELVKARWNRAIPSEWISLDDFVCAEISWGPKAEAVGRILSDVSLTPAMSCSSMTIRWSEKRCLQPIPAFASWGKTLC
ncbi:hypothetical protein ACFSUK_15380 [Sphingobium scionense]